LKDKITILVTNDDGIRAEGITSLAAGLRHLGRIVTVAPENEQSATSHAITLDRPLRVKDYGNDRYGVTGTPTDCVLLAVQGIIGFKPDLVVSGINHGPNLGEDVLYSGTVAAAIEGCIMGISSIAFSIASWDPHSFSAASSVSAFLTGRMLENKGDETLLWNVNIPSVPEEEIKGIKVTKLASRIYNDSIIKDVDPRGKEYYWIGGGEPGWNRDDDSDFSAVTSNFVSLTPLSLDMNDNAGIKRIKSWNLVWNGK